MKTGKTISEAAHEWVSTFNAIPRGMIERLMMDHIDDWTEVTVPAVGNQVYVDGENGEIEKITKSSARVRIYSGDEEKIKKYSIDDIEVIRDDMLPMWGTMWSFGDSCDDYWLEQMDGIRIMSECGFRIFSHDEFGYFFGIDGAGYSFYEEHWIPLYKKRGLKWHDTREVKANAS